MCCNGILVFDYSWFLDLYLEAYYQAFLLVVGTLTFVRYAKRHTVVCHQDSKSHTPLQHLSEICLLLETTEESLNLNVITWLSQYFQAIHINPFVKELDRTYDTIKVQRCFVTNSDLINRFIKASEIVPDIEQSNLKVGADEVLYWFVIPWVWGLGAGMLRVIALWNFLLRGSTVTTGETATPRPRSLAVSSESIIWAWKAISSWCRCQFFSQKTKRDSPMM